MTSTQLSKLLWEPSTGFLPDMISSRKTPKAKTSVFSSTMPCMKYSGAKHLRRHRQLPCRFRALMPILGSIQELRDEYPNVPSIGATACDWTVEKQQVPTAMSYRSFQAIGGEFSSAGDTSKDHSCESTPTPFLGIFDRVIGFTVEIGRDGAAGGELEDQVEVAVDAAAEKSRHIGVPHMADGAELRQEVLLSLLVRGGSRQPLHGNRTPVLHHAPVHLRVPTSAHQEKHLQVGFRCGELTSSISSTCLLSRTGEAFSCASSSSLLLLLPTVTERRRLRLLLFLHSSRILRLCKGEAECSRWRSTLQAEGSRAPKAKEKRRRAAGGMKWAVRGGGWREKRRH
ncbi:hypothetical protein B296_00000401 [Ensete ventricosum]|uniref:Uncharacterized protein n=1 Tax=Ensete ventricosum TaxID=4639 RepID=A0A427BCG3_ENSVE|nr:hypothetical protein B296_00000401 [Ensete ventricosum]